MGESLLLITIITLIVLTIRRARPVVLENPLVIERTGQYRLTFAPQLNQAQRFVEAVASRFRESGDLSGDLAAQYFIVRDPKAKPANADYYLLAIAHRDGMLYAQVVNPQSRDGNAQNDLNTVREFSVKALASHPCRGSEDGLMAARLTKAVESVATETGIVATRLHEAG